MDRAFHYKCALVIRLSALGDVAMTIPAIYPVCYSYPGTRFVVVTTKIPAGLFVNKPDNLTVEGVEFKHGCRGIPDLARVFRSLLARYHFDVLVDLHDVLRSRILSLFCRMHGIPVFRIDKGRREKHRLTRKSHKLLAQLPTSHERYMTTLARAGFNTDITQRFVSVFTMPPDPSTFAAATRPKQPGETWVAIAPFARHKGKIYPPDKTGEILSTLAARRGYRLFLFGGGGEEKRTLDTWAESRPNITSLAGKHYGFATELALLSYMDVMLSMDSANMHLASLVGVKVVSVWGATHPYCGFAGWNQDYNNCVQADLPCRPCSVFGNRPCRFGDYPCLTTISRQSIVSRIDHVLADKNKKRIE